MKKDAPGRKKATWKKGETNRFLGRGWLMLLDDFPALGDPKKVTFGDDGSGEFRNFIDGVGDLQKLLAPIEALEILQAGETITQKNLSEAFQGKLEAIRRMRDIVREESFCLTQDRKESMEDHLQEYENTLERRIRKAKIAENYLSTLGWQFNPATGKTTMKKPGGLDSLRECIRRVYAANHQGKKPSPYVCRMVKKELSYFEGVEIALIYDTIDKAVRRRR